MAYTLDGLRVLACNETGGLAMWSYKTHDAWDAVTGDGYFREAHSLFRTGDFIFVNAETDAGTVSGIVVVVSKMLNDVVTAELVAPVAYEPSAEAA